jgi:3-oxoacyl-[acyl-carrier-protein] synthase II
MVTSIGTGVADFLAGLREGRCGAKPITSFDTSGFAHAVGCEVLGFEADPWVRTLSLGTLGRASQFSIAAARMALEDGGLGAEVLRSERSLVAVGTTEGECRDLEHLVRTQVDRGPELMEPAIARRVSAARLSASVAQELELTNVESVTIPTACAAGNYAIGYGYDTVGMGEATFALCGGADAFCQKTFAGFYRLGTVAPEVCQPFDRHRKGILTGEGSAILLLEDLETARERGARIYAEVLGYGLNCDAYHPVSPDRTSVARCMQAAHAAAGVEPEDVDLISAHGTGTRANDVTEAAAIRHVFGDDPPPTISLKGMLGHAMGAASAIASAGCALAIAEGFIPPTINHVETDPECNLSCVPNQARAADLRVVQNNGLAFGGNNAVVVFGTCEASS